MKVMTSQIPCSRLYINLALKISFVFMKTLLI